MKTCIECKQDKDDLEFNVSHYSESKTYTERKCKQCERGKPKGLLGKLSEDEIKSLTAHKADYADPNISAADFYKKCGLSMSLQSFYRYNRLGKVGLLMRTL